MACTVGATFRLFGDIEDNPLKKKIAGVSSIFLFCIPISICRYFSGRGNNRTLSSLVIIAMAVTLSYMSENMEKSCFNVVRRVPPSFIAELSRRQLPAAPMKRRAEQEADDNISLLLQHANKALMSPQCWHFEMTSEHHFVLSRCRILCHVSALIC